MEPTPALWALLRCTCSPVARRMPSCTETERCEKEAIRSSFHPADQRRREGRSDSWKPPETKPDGSSRGEMLGFPGSWLPHSLPSAARKASLRSGLCFPLSISNYGLNVGQEQHCVRWHCRAQSGGCLWGDWGAGRLGAQVSWGSVSHEDVAPGLRQPSRRPPMAR